MALCIRLVPNCVLTLKSQLRRHGTRFHPETLHACPWRGILTALQLLMALHDLGETELCTKESCHKLAWTLDACLKVRLPRRCNDCVSGSRWSPMPHPADTPTHASPCNGWNPQSMPRNAPLQLLPFAPTICCHAIDVGRVPCA